MTGDAANGAPRAWQPVRVATFPGAPAVPGAPQPLGRRVDGTLRKTTDGGAPVPQPSWTVGGAGAAPRRTAPTITLNPSFDRSAASRSAASPTPAAPTSAKRRCMLTLLRENIERAGGSLGGSADVNLSALPDVNGRHYCCVADDALVPSHPAAHDPHGSDGVDETVRAIVSVGGTVADAAAAMSRRAAEARAEDDVFADECVVSLHCPLSSARMTVPGRGEACEHAECFDLHTFVRCAVRATRVSRRTRCAAPLAYPECHPMHTAKKPLGRCDFCKHWRCPICRTPTTIGALRFDPFTDDIIKNNPGLRRVKVTRSKGTYAPALDEDARGDDDAERIDDARAVRPASNGKGEADGDGDDTRDGDATRGASGPEVIELSDASDEEMDSAAAAPARDRDPPYFRRALFLLANETVEKISGELRGPKSGVFCVHAATRGKAESGLMDHLEKTLRDVYAMTKTLDHEDRDSLSAMIAAHKTGERFQKFRRLVKDNRLEASPLGNRLRVVLTLMSHSRDHWKAVIRKTEIPPPMKEPSTEQAAKSEKGKAATNAASGSKKRESAEGAPSPVTTKKAKNAVASMTTKTATEKTDEDAGGGSGGTEPAKSAQPKSKATSTRCGPSRER